MSGYGLRMTKMESRKFLFSNVATALKKDLVTKIKSLGGCAIDNNNFDKNISHLVCGSLKKTEKYFGACICGKWIISPQYILDSYEVDMWLDEENYLFRVENKDPLKDNLALTARRWRSQICFHGVVPFQDWRVALLMTAEKAAVFKRLLRYGGAEILKLSVPFSKCTKIRYVSYVFMDDSHVKYVSELQELGLLCLKEKFLGDFIMMDPTPDPFDYIVVHTADNETLLDCSVGPKHKDMNIESKGSSTANLPSSCEHISQRDVDVTVNAPCSSDQSASVENESSHNPHEINVNNTKSLRNKQSGGMNNSVECNQAASSKQQKRRLNGIDNFVESSEVENQNIDKPQSELSTTKSTIKSDGFSNSVKHVENSFHPSTQLNPAIDSMKQATKQNGKLAKLSAPENDIAHKTKTSRVAKKSYVALEYLDPNVPSVKLISLNQKDPKPSSLSDSTNHPMSSQFSPIRSKGDNKFTSGSAQKRKSSPNEVDKKSSKHKRQRYVKDYANFHKQGRGIKSLSVNIYLHNPPITPTKKTMETTELDQANSCSDFELLETSERDMLGNGKPSKQEDNSERFKESETHSSCILKSDESTSQKGDCDSKSANSLPVSAEHTPKKCNQIVMNLSRSELDTKEHGSQPRNVSDGFIFKTPVKSNTKGPSLSKNKSPSASLTLSPNVYLYGLSPSKIPRTNHSFEIEAVSSETNLTPVTVKSTLNAKSTPVPVVSSPKTKSTPVSVMSSPKTKLTPVSVMSSPKTKSTPVLVVSSPKTKSTPVPVMSSPKTKLTPVSVMSSPKTKLTPVSVMSSPKTKSTPVSVRCSPKSVALKEKQKPSQCVLQQFGFRSVSKNKDGQNAQRMNVLIPKSEPISPSQSGKALSRKEPKNQACNIPKVDESEIVVILSDDNDDDSYMIEPRIHLSQSPFTSRPVDEITVSSGNEEESTSTKQSDIVNISSGTEEDDEDCDRVRKNSKFNPQNKSCSVSSKKVTKPAGNVFENMSSYISKASDEVNTMLREKERKTSGNIENSQEDGQVKNIGDEIDSHHDVKNSQRDAFYAKRQLFRERVNTYSSSSSYIDHFTNINDKVNLKEHILSEKKRGVDSKCKNIDKHSSPSKEQFSSSYKAHVSRKKTSLIHYEHGSLSSEYTQSDDSDYCNVRMDQLPHISWSSIYSYSKHVTPAPAEKQFMPSIVSQCMESSRENGFYCTALDHGKPTMARMPNVDLLRELIHLLTCDDVMVKNQAFSDLMLWTQNHPPTTSSMIKVYSDLLELTTDQTLLCSLLSGLTGIQDSKENFHLLEFIVSVFEINFSSCLQSKDRKTLKDCLLIKWFWSHSQAIHHNRKTKELLRAFETVLSQPQSSSIAIQSVSTLISMVAECFRLSSVNWSSQNRSFLSDTVTSFALDIAKIIRDACSDEEPFHIISHLLSFKPAWFRTMLTASILSFFNDYLLNESIQVRDISLRAIVSQYLFLLPPLSSREHFTANHKSTVLSLSSQHQDDDISAHSKIQNNCVDNFHILKDKNLTATKVNRVNGKGESSLHLAAKKGDLATMKKLLSIPGVDVNLKDNNSWTPLHEACNHGKFACVELLLKYVPPNTVGSFFYKKDGISSKVDINAFGDQNITPLHDAVINNRVEICKLLLKYGGKHLLETKTVKGYTALDLASTKEMSQVLSAGLNNSQHCSSYFHNLSQDSEDSLSLSQSELNSSSDYSNTFPSDHMYEQVLNVDDTGNILSANYPNCSVFVSLITLLLNSYLDATSVTTPSQDPDRPSKVSLLKIYETNILKRMRFYVRVFKKHLRRITMPDTFDCLQAQLLMLTALISHHTIER